jgi:hypothetical protein
MDEKATSGNTCVKAGKTFVTTRVAGLIHGENFAGCLPPATAAANYALTPESCRQSFNPSAARTAFVQIA